MNIIKFTAIISSVILAAGQLCYLPSGIEKAYSVDEVDVLNQEMQFIFDDENGTCAVDNNYTYYNDVFIPDTATHNGKTYAVTYVNVSSFKYATSLHIGANVESIYFGYDELPYLTEITVSPDNKVYSVEAGVLYGKYKSFSGEIRTAVEFYPTSRKEKEYVIPKGTESIPCFHNNPYIESLKINDDIENGIYLQLNNCESLKTIYIPDSITEIYTDAFNGCSALTDIYYGGSANK